MAWGSDFWGEGFGGGCEGRGGDWGDWVSGDSLSHSEE